MLHSLPPQTAEIPTPSQFTYPYYYTPHPLCQIAAEEVKANLRSHPKLWEEAQKGKMFGVLIVAATQPDGSTKRGYLAAFSGILAGSYHWEGFVPPIYDLLNPDSHFLQEEAEISRLTQTLDTLQNAEEYLSAKAQLQSAQNRANAQLANAKAQLQRAKAERQARRAAKASSEAELTRESQYQKGEYNRLKRSHQKLIAEAEKRLKPFDQRIQAITQERASRSANLQRWLFEQYQMRNANGEIRTLTQIFKGMPPAGSGECCAPKLLQTAYQNNWKPLCMAEFWVGASPRDELRIDGNYYPACRSKCRPILKHALAGLNVEPNPILERNRKMVAEVTIVYEDYYLVVLNKPSGMLSVPGNEDVPSVKDEIQRRYPKAAGPMIVQRLDMDTSGLMVVALNPLAYRHLQQQFIQREAKKRYLAILENSNTLPLPPPSGIITLPLCPNPDDRPRQMVNTKFGLKAETHFSIISTSPHLRLHLWPLTGRTHQLRVHCAHPDGLNRPIIGDTLYGTPNTRLMLHAEMLEFRHPRDGKLLHFEAPPPF